MLAIVALFVSQVLCAESLAIEPFGQTQPVPTTYFGMHIHRADTTTPWPNAGFGSWRLWDAHVNWVDLEPSRGEWNFERLDRLVAMAKLTKVDVLLPLALTPTWASARPLEKSSYGLGNAAEPADIEDWKTYVRTVATRYRGRVYHYELWNEVNIPSFYSGSKEQLIQLARETYTILKEVDSRNVLVGPSVTGGGKHLDWLSGYFQKGGGQYLDVVAYHFYVPNDAPEAMLSLISSVQRIMQQNGLSSKPLWNTESGWGMLNYDGTPKPAWAYPKWEELESNVAAAYVSRALILNWAAGVQRFYFYAWDNSLMGLMEPTSKALKPAAMAYTNTLHWIVGKKISKCVSSSNGVWSCDLLARQKLLAKIVWTQRGTRLYKIPRGWGAKSVAHLYDISQSTVSADGLEQIGIEPILIYF